jgi:trk system potassium uptake protein TrkH
MLIGGSTGSTAGGMKMGTVAVMLLVTISIFKQENEVNAFNRRIPKEVIKKAAAIFTMYISLFLSGTLLLCLLEGLPALTCAFETASAIATVGLTMGITPELCAASKILLAFLMFCGRVGGLTIIFAAGKTLIDSTSKYPTEKIQIG